MYIDILILFFIFYVLRVKNSNHGCQKILVANVFDAGALLLIAVDAKG